MNHESGEGGGVTANVWEKALAAAELRIRSPSMSIAFSGTGNLRKIRVTERLRIPALGGGGGGGLAHIVMAAGRDRAEPGKSIPFSEDTSCVG